MPSANELYPAIPDLLVFVLSDNEVVIWQVAGNGYFI